MLLFYLGFVFVVIPTFLLVLGWGYRVERFQAGLFILLYTIFASLPFLFLLVKFFWWIGSLSFSLIYFFSLFLDRYWWFCIRIIFLVKIPAFLLHIWLPKAHVEAPLAGSMILAGVLLKLGGYGFFKRFFIFSNEFNFVKLYIISLGLVRRVIVRIVCLRQTDSKKLVAYSSVSHIGPVLSSIATIIWGGWIGGLYIMLAHGICSSGLFYCLNLFYERFFSRRIFLLKARNLFFPIYIYWWFSLCLCNIGCPPTFNFFSEFIIVVFLLSYTFSRIFIIILILLLGGIYSIYLYVIIRHGGFLWLGPFSYLRKRELLLLLIHSFPLFFMYFLIRFLN